MNGVGKWTAPPPRPRVALADSVKGRIVRPRRAVTDDDGFVTRQQRAGIVVTVKADSKKLVRDFLYWCGQNGVDAVPVEQREFVKKDGKGRPVVLEWDDNNNPVRYALEERPSAYQCDVFGKDFEERLSRLNSLVEREAVVSWTPIMDVRPPGMQSVVRIDMETGIPVTSARDFAPKFRKLKGKPKPKDNRPFVPKPESEAQILPENVASVVTDRDAMDVVRGHVITEKNGRVTEKSA